MLNQRYMRYTDNYLVNDEHDMDIENNVKPKHKWKLQNFWCISLLVIAVLLIVVFLLVFVGFPLAFMNCVSLQQALIFTRWNLNTNKTYFEEYRFPGLKNHKIKVRDIDNKTDIELGLWHILPLELTEYAINDKDYNFEEALLNSNYNVLLYFHGTGEDRSQSQRKYQLLRIFFHVIAFDYRGYGDSTEGPLFENNVVSDCVEVFKWLSNKTNSPIYFWGHSLGTALATNTLTRLKSDEYNINGVILEAPFTTLKDELYNHAYVKYFTWLPWFEATVIKPLERNGFIFNTSSYILDVMFPVLFLHAEDDEVIPFYMSEELYTISKRRNVSEEVKNNTMIYIFQKSLGLNHFFIYQDPYVIFYLYDFLRRSTDSEVHHYNGSHQS